MNFDETIGTTTVERSPSYRPRRSWRTWLIGNPLQTADAPHQTIGKVVGLAVFASDALSSSAYSNQEILLILAAAGVMSFRYAPMITLAIVALLVILTISYEQTIHAYPGGGGAYIVARDNLGELPAQTAGAALLMDYILTVAVSISSGVAQIVSAYPAVYPFRVELAVLLVLMVMLINLRGVKESGIIFAIPTYFFFLMMIITIGTGMYRYFTGTLGTVVNPPMDLMTGTVVPVTTFLILRAFAGGTSAVTGVEAISNGITAFKEPRSKNAGITLIWMAIILGVLLMGVAMLSYWVGAYPSEEETIFSQLARTIFESRGLLYFLMITSTTVILIMAANTAFADFPRLGAITAGDGFLPRQMMFRGDRLVYSRGIMALAAIASLLIIGFQASVTKLIPLYAIGVFLSFTLSQTGMARRWWKVGHLKSGEELVEAGSTLRFEKGWEGKMIVNGFGAVTTLVVMVIFAYTKFNDGAWVVVLLIPMMVSIFFAIHHHYKSLARNLSLDNFGSPPNIKRRRVILPVAGVHRGTLAALRYAHSLSEDITAVHVSIDPVETEKVKKKWDVWGDGVRLVVLDSPYRVFLEPLIEYIAGIDEQCQDNEVITIVVPQFIPKHWWARWLHTRTADQLRKVLLNYKEIVIMEVPYQV